MSLALANIVDGEELRAAIRSFEVQYGILQSVPQIHIGKIEELQKELKGEIYPDSFESGRLFSPDLEIRWRKKAENQFYVLIIDDKDESREGYERKDLIRTENPLSFYLWGEKAEDMWYELRIPKGWKYPVKTRYARIKAIEYEVRGKAKESKFYRFCGFEGEQQ